MRLLVIEDNQDIAANLLEYLHAHGHAVNLARDGITGLHRAKTDEYDAIVLDLILPGMDGLTLCRRLREEARRQTPVLMLTARDSLDDKIQGLEAGADDYLVKPYALREVEARLRTIARRLHARILGQRLQVADLIFDVDTYRLTRGERGISLPPIPLKILEVLMRASPRVVRREEIQTAVWGDDPPDSDALKAHIHVLRSAVDRESDRPLVHTLRGLGYQVADTDGSPS